MKILKNNKNDTVTHTVKSLKDKPKWKKKKILNIKTQNCNYANLPDNWCDNECALFTKFYTNLAIGENDYVMKHASEFASKILAFSF